MKVTVEAWARWRVDLGFLGCLSSAVIVRSAIKGVGYRVAGEHRRGQPMSFARAIPHLPTGLPTHTGVLTNAERAA